MPFVRRPLPRFFAGLALSTCATFAVAASSASSVSVTSFAYTTSAASVLTWLDPYQSFSATTLAAGGLLGAQSDAFETNGYGLAIVGASLGPLSAAVSTTTPQTFWATASTASSSGSPNNLPNQAQALAGQSGTFRLSEAGTVTFTVGYSVGVSAPGGNPITDHGTAQLAFLLADADGNSGGSQQTTLMSFSQLSGVASQNGTFTLTVSLSAGEAGFYSLQGNATAFSTAAVPEPGAAVLLLGGLAGLGLYGRLRRRPAPDAVQHR